jgi:phosphoserine phosphatase RsbU/P
MMLFGIHFPNRLELDRRYPWAKWIVIAPILFRVLGPNLLTDILTLRDAVKATRVGEMFDWTRPIVTAMHLVAISAFFAALGYNTFVEKQPDARRRLRLLYTGATIAITPLLIAFILGATGAVTLSDGWISALLVILFVFPLTMAYIVVVERAMDVRLVVRQGVQYLLARGTIRVIQVAGSLAVFFAAVAFFPRSLSLSGSSLARLIPVGIGVMGIIGIGRFSDRLRRWVDRRFFRESYDAEQILAELATQVRTIVEMRPLLETVAHRISGALHVPRLAILVNSGTTLEPAYAVGYSDVRRITSPTDVSRVSSDSDLRSVLDAELVLPLSANRKLVGVMALGPKQSEEPFTSSDVRLLETVAGQTGLALENSRLTALITAEIAEREKRNRELEIAREVQQRLFPQTYPVVDGLEVVGSCRPALEVGGDYYDFVPLDAARLGIAIGDISGKGIPASLLMATLRAYLRGQTIQAQQDLAGMVTNLNALVYESSATNRYATFFYAQYDPATRVLDYVNAGHNPPMVFRASTGHVDVIRLDIGGPVIGLLPKCTYEQGRIILQREDVVVSFTDGVSEAMNVDMEEWGEERLIETVAPGRTLPLTELMARIMAGADAHTGAAPQHDDMTLVLARCV